MELIHFIQLLFFSELCRKCQFSERLAWYWIANLKDINFKIITESFVKWTSSSKGNFIQFFDRSRFYPFQCLIKFKVTIFPHTRPEFPMFRLVSIFSFYRYSAPLRIRQFSLISPLGSFSRYLLFGGWTSPALSFNQQIVQMQMAFISHLFITSPFCFSSY